MAGWPLGWARPGWQPGGICPAVVHGAPVSGPVSTAPDGASRKPAGAAGLARVADASTRLAAAGWLPAAARRFRTGPATGAQLPDPATDEYSEKLVQSAA